MANSLKHLGQWQHNRSLLSLVPESYPDWIVTVAFYTALHEVDAALSAYGQSVISHETRNEILIRTTQFLKIRTHYLPMYSLSRIIRYLAKPQEWVPHNQIEMRIFQGHLYPIEQSVRAL